MVSRFFSKIYKAWEEKQIKKYEKILDILKEYSIDIRRCKVLNIGCNGFFLEKFLIEKGLIKENFVSIDIDKYVVKEYNLIRKKLLKNKVNFILGSGIALPFRKESFDLIFCVDVAHLLKSLDELYFILAKKGYLVLASFFNFSDEEKIRKEFITKLNRFKILKEFLLFDEENELIFLARKEGNENGKK